MKAYIAGKITDDPNYKQKFRQAQEDLEGQGFAVINPVILPEGMGTADYMRICIAMLDSADVVAFLPDWEQSRGARLEFDWCQYVGKQTMYLEAMSFYRPWRGDSAETPVAVRECPACAGDTIVVDTKTLSSGEVWRRRKCLECGIMFYSIERFRGMAKSAEKKRGLRAK